MNNIYVNRYQTVAKERKNTPVMPIPIFLGSLAALTALLLYSLSVLT